MLTENMLRVDKEDTTNPLVGGDIEVHGVAERNRNGGSDGGSIRDTSSSQLPITPIPEVRGSSAYRLSLQRNNSKRAELAAEGHDSADFDFREFSEEEGGRESVHNLPLHASGGGGELPMSRLPPAQKLRLIGRKTVCMAVVLSSFGLAMMVTSFFFIRKHLNDRGFLLFFLVGVCALLPGLYACYNILGKYLGWRGFEHSLPSYDRRVT